MPLSESDYLKGANDEYVGRLQARNRIILTFITVSGTLIGVAAAQYTAGFAFLAVGVGFFSLATALLNRHHEWTIGHLTAYQRKLIAVAESRPLCEGWHNFRMEQMDDTRKHRDMAVFWIHVLFCFAALGIAAVREFSAPEGSALWGLRSFLLGTPQWPEWFTVVKRILWFASAGCALYSFRVIILTQKKRSCFSKLTAKEEAEAERIRQLYVFEKSIKPFFKETKPTDQEYKSRQIR